MKYRSIFLAASLLLACISPCEKLSKTAVGRFGAGKKITANTATQDLLAWNVRNTGKAIDLRFYDAKGGLVSLGYCGFPTSSAVQNKVHDIGWTQLWTSYTSKSEKIDVLESLLTPVLWFKVSGARIKLFQPDEVAYISPKIVNLMNQGPWAAAVIESKDILIPVGMLFHSKPSSVRKASDGVAIEWSKPGQWIGLVPLNGCRPASPLTQSQIRQKAQDLAKRFMKVPAELDESYLLAGPRKVVIKNTVKWIPSKDDWGLSKDFCMLPNAVSLSRHAKYPIAITQPVKPFKYDAYLGPLEYVDGSAVTYSLPVPDLYSTLAPPTNDPALVKHLPDVTQETIKDYSDYIVKSYQGREKSPIFPNSSLGEARMLATDYVNYRMMSAEAQKAFGDWSDWAAVDRLYNTKNFGGCIEVGNGQKFVLDNYRFGGRDYMDAGWFGYAIQAMWARAHYGNKWNEVENGWKLIKDLFYGWNWVYLDFGACCAPLYVDADAGGNPKGYTDSMSMLGALFAWARMADRLGDKQTYQDSLYMLAKDRLGRFARMLEHEWAAKCGFQTDVYYLTSDMGNGPNIAMTSRYIPDKGIDTNRDVVDYGPANQGLWYITGSFLEPVTAETIDMMLTGAAAAKVKSTNELMDKRYPRWWASPAAGEAANYQIYLRGALFNEDPVWLRYVFEYQNPFGKGIWYAESWHGNAFAGIVMSSMRGLRHQDDWSVSSSYKGLIEKNLWRLDGGRLAFTLYSHAPKAVGASVAFNRNLRNYGVAKFIDAKSGRTADPLNIQIRPGINVFIERNAPLAIAPVSAIAYASQPNSVPLVITNNTPSKKEYLIQDGETSGIYSAQLKPGESYIVNLAFQGVSNASAASEHVYYFNGQQKIIRLFTLPTHIGQIELEAARVVTLPNLGKATLVLVNQIDSPVSVKARWGLDGTSLWNQEIEIKPLSTLRYPLDLKADSVKPGKHELFVEVEGIVRQQIRQIITTGSKDPILVFDFAQDADGWTMPDWPDANKSSKGEIFKPFSQDQALCVPLSFNKKDKSEGFIGYQAASGWSQFRSISLDLWVPADAPKELLGSFYMMGDGWKWRIPPQSQPLVPGKWNHIEAPLNDDNLKAYWNIPYEEFLPGLKYIIDIGVRITKPAGVDKYKGLFKIDNVTVVPR